MSFTNNLNKYLIELNDNKWSNKISDYELLSLMGSGSFGRVYRAKSQTKEELSQRRDCAVKCIAKKSSPNIGKILTEVSIHLRLRNDHILQLYNVIEDEDYVYLVLELCVGGTLAQFVKQRVETHKDYNHKHMNGSKNKVPSNEKLISDPVLCYDLTRNIIKQLCLGLDYLHRNSIVHRDLNLNNILLVSHFHNNNDLVIKIADFGLAIDLNSSKVQNLSKPCREDHVIPLPIGTTICGTPGFISPEVWSQMQTVSPKSDVFSLGSILFSCISGFTPKGELDLSHFCPFAADLISRLLAPNPENRIAIEDVLKHPFILGPFKTQRLLPINKLTKTIQLTIDSEGNVLLKFFKNQSTIEITKDGENITLNGHQRDREIKYTFHTLPSIHWKKYIYALRFVELVKAKTPKITVYCKNHNNNNEYINKCCLMENQDFEVTIFDSIRNENYKILINEHNNVSQRKFAQRISELHNYCMQMEKHLENSSKTIGIDCFPAVFGHKNKTKADSTQTLSTQQPFISSQILRSTQIEGIGVASQLSNGIIEVSFNDGSSMSITTNSQIIFSTQSGVQKRYSKHDPLPEFVKDKLALLPQAVYQLRQTQSLQN